MLAFSRRRFREVDFAAYFRQIFSPDQIPDLARSLLRISRVPARL